MTIAPAERTTGRARRYGFYAAVAVVVVLSALAFGPGLLFPAVVWLPDATLDSIFGEEGVGIHRVHGAGLSTLLWAVLVCMLVQFRRPERRVAPIWLAVVGLWAAIVIDILTGIFEPGVLVFGVLVALVGLLHPSSPLVARPRSSDRAAAGASLVAAVPLAVYAISQLRAQLAGVEADPHVAHGHYAGMAEVAIVILIAAFLGASDAHGARIASWIAGLGALLIGAVSVAFGGHASSLGPWWGAAAVLWGIGYMVVAGRRRAGGAEPVGEVAT